MNEHFDKGGHKPPLWNGVPNASGYRFAPMSNCRHGADCVKYGCAFNHPPHRRNDCRYGENCSVFGCKKLHPRSSSKHSTSVPPWVPRDANDIRAKLKPGTIVLCKRQPCDPVWSSAKLIRLMGQTVTVKLEDSAEPENMPLSAIRCPPPKTPCRHGVSCVKFGCMFIHPEGRRKDCPRGASCRDIHCVHLHPVTRNAHLQSTKIQPPKKIIYRNLSIVTNLDSETKSTAVKKSQSAAQQRITTPKAESALHLLMKAIDSNEAFMQSDENLRLLKILGLKAQKMQAVLAEDFLSAHKIKTQIDNLCNTK